jgi:hypothetical protein
MTLFYRVWRAELARELDEAALHARLVALVAAEPATEVAATKPTKKQKKRAKPAASPPRFSPDTQVAIVKALFEVAPWMSSGNRVGDEAVRGWCWCHGPWRGGRTPEAIASSIVGELHDARAWHLAVLAWIEASEPPGRDPVALARLVAGVVELVIGLGIHDSWYGLIVPVTVWTLEHHGIGLPDDVVETIDNLCSTSFTSWTAPPRGAREQFAESVALALLEREMVIRWG